MSKLDAIWRSLITIILTPYQLKDPFENPMGVTNYFPR